MTIYYMYPWGQISLPSFSKCLIDAAASGLCPADLDGDGDLDMAAVDKWEETVSWWENANGEGTVWTFHPLTAIMTHPRGITCADFDSDGDIDIAVSGGYSLYWLESSSGGGSWTPHLIEQSVSYFYHISTGDFDADGDADLVGINPAQGELVWLENSGSASAWARHTIDPSFADGDAVICADVDEDGLVDVISASPDSYTIAWWKNPSTGTTWVKHTIADGFEDASDMATGDMDNDGDLDVVCCTRGVLSPGLSNDHLSWWSNNDGSGLSWTQHQINSDPEGVWALSISIGDFDGDGDLDVLEPNCMHDRVAWWRNLDGSGGTWEQNWLTMDMEKPLSTASADVDSDGIPELFVGGEYFESMMWNADAYPLTGELVSSILYVNDADWLGISWAADTPIGTAVSFQVRASDDCTQMGAWSDTLTAPCPLDGILENYDSFVQYKAILSRSTQAVTPVLEDVTIAWNSLGLEGGEAPGAVELNVSSNPSVGSPSLEFGLPSDMEVSLSVFDLAGRVVAATEPGYCSAGWHAENLGELPPGVYFVRLTAGEVEASERFVVIE